MKIVVLCGGISTEREISFRTSAKVANALSKKGHDIIMADVLFGLETIPEFKSDKRDFFAIADEYRKKDHLIDDELRAKNPLFGPNILEVCKMADIVFIGLHGENGEDGRIQKAFEDEGVKYTGSDSASSSVAMSKARTKDVMSKHFLMPEGIVVKKGEKIPDDLPLPCVIKPSNGGSSVGVLIIKSKDELEKAFEEDFHLDDTLLVEKYIDGRELTQAVLDGVALPPVEIIPEGGDWYDYENKYNGLTKEVCPADIPEDVLKEMSEISVEFGKILGLDVYYRIDYLLDKDGNLFALEANSLPGMTDTSLVPQEAAAVGMDYPSLCEKIIEVSLRKYN